ncbi:hypothetical protein TcBrA4_0054320 [Trypanosoma cruzi]|nr:hypothetical protein TcBrA4_0054320 [Trypanosoma cruzi]
MRVCCAEPADWRERRGCCGGLLDAQSAASSEGPSRLRRGRTRSRRRTGDGLAAAPCAVRGAAGSTRETCGRTLRFWWRLGLARALAEGIFCGGCRQEPCALAMRPPQRATTANGTGILGEAKSQQCFPHEAVLAQGWRHPPAPKPAACCGSNYSPMVSGSTRCRAKCGP